MGEFAAFVVGWNLLLEQVIGVALVAKGIAAYVDVLIFDRAGVNITQVQPVSSNISDYFDFFAFFIPILVGGKIGSFFAGDETSVIERIRTISQVHLC